MATIREEIASLETVLPRLSAKDRSFAEDLLRGKFGFHTRGSLSAKQMDWVRILTTRGNTPAAPRETVEVGNFSAMIALFDGAAKSLKSPSVALHDETVGEIRISIATGRSAFPGTINVATPGGYGNNTWFGRILRDGRFEMSPRNASPVSLLALLTRFAAQPAQTAAEFGKLHGRCAFCNKGLDDERSTSVGYGPVCAKKWGLPWGVAPVARTRVRSSVGSLPFHPADRREIAA